MKIANMCIIMGVRSHLSPVGAVNDTVQSQRRVTGAAGLPIVITHNFAKSVKIYVINNRHFQYQKWPHRLQRVISLKVWVSNNWRQDCEIEELECLGEKSSWLNGKIRKIDRTYTILERNVNVVRAGDLHVSVNMWRHICYVLYRVIVSNFTVSVFKEVSVYLITYNTKVCSC